MMSRAAGSRSSTTGTPAARAQAQMTRETVGRDTPAMAARSDWGRSSRRASRTRRTHRYIPRSTGSRHRHAHTTGADRLADTEDEPTTDGRASAPRGGLPLKVFQGVFCEHSKLSQEQATTSSDTHPLKQPQQAYE